MFFKQQLSCYSQDKIWRICTKTNKLTILSGSLAGLKFPREFIVIWKKERYIAIHEKFVHKEEIQNCGTVSYFWQKCAAQAEAMHQYQSDCESRLKSNLQQSRFCSGLGSSQKQVARSLIFALELHLSRVFNFYFKYNNIHLLFDRQSANLLRW